MRRRSSPILFRYLLAEFLLPLVCCLLAFTALFILADVLDELQDFLDAGAPVRQTLLFFALRQPSNLVNVFPMSILLSASLMVHLLGRHHEISALRAAGLSLITVCRPVWLVAIVFACLAFWVGERAAPQCLASSEQILVRWTKDQDVYRDVGKARLCYGDAGTRRNWWFRVFNPGGTHEELMVTQFREDGTTEWELQAKSARFENDEWVFRDGAILRFDDEGRLPSGAAAPFSEHRVRMAETPRRMAGSVRPLEEMTVFRILRSLRTQVGLPSSMVSALKTTAWYRFLFPFSCVIGALFGVSLSLSPQRSSALRGFAAAVALMVLYYMVSQMFMVFGRNGHIPPFVGGALPTLVFLLAAARLMYARR